MLRIAAFLRLALFLALVGLLGIVGSAQARESYSGHSVRLSDLPPEALQTLQLIRHGGPFPYPLKDGSTFGNFEKHLPPQARGYYREYTVPTPGSRSRGARRIIAGSGRDQSVTNSGEYYYTDDHYRSFRRIHAP